ncbi:MAG: dTDP-4-dehydrorhamnose 3,5-epimerase [Leptospiraceae bacterium]|nr:MAG: dTDP-4-dehydrorhamnose 3,5-epimerase [Leptospiraceae bacterium]
MKVLITGASGYIGSLLIKKLEQNPYIEKIIAIDIKKNIDESFKIKFYLKDIRDSDICNIIKLHQINVVVHLASIVNPPRNMSREEQYSIDVKGTENILECAGKNMIQKFIITSSGAAYGYYSDNPIPLKETDPIRGNKEFPYSYHKRIIEKKLEYYKNKYPLMKQYVFRVSTILGKNTSNQITNLFQKKFLIGIKGSDSPFCFIWDQDVVDCIEDAIFADPSKADVYNLTGDGFLTIDEIGRLLNKKVIYFPEKILKLLLKILYFFKLSPYSSEQVLFLQYRPVLDNTKLKEIFGYIPKKTSRETFYYFIMENRS